MQTAAIVFRDGVTKIFQVNPNERLLDAAFRNGVSLPLDCREGVCATCRGLCESGKIEMDYVDEDALSEDEVAAGYVLSCQTTLKSDASFYFDMDSTVCNVETKTYEAIVSGITQVSDAAAILEVALKDSESMSYLPGQYAHISIPGTQESRSYSFATSKIVEGKLKFLMRLLPDGVMSNYLRERCKIGDQMILKSPYGAFYLREVERPLLLIAGGTGLSAILSMLDQLSESEQKDMPVRVVYGVRKEDDISELERLSAYSEKLGDYCFDVVLSDSSDSWEGKKGYVTDCMDLSFLKQSLDIYICGPPGMISACETWLSTLKADDEIGEHKVYFERFVSS